MAWREWYNSLAKPSWTPAPATISLMRMTLYPIILCSFVFVQAFRGMVGWQVAIPFAVNLVANLLFMPIFSGVRNVPLVALDTFKGYKRHGSKEEPQYIIKSDETDHIATHKGSALKKIKKNTR